MAETLGSLIDKLSIKSIREFHLHKMLAKKRSSKVLSKIDILKKQKSLLLNEVEEFIRLAISGKIQLRDEKLKLYNRPQMVGKIAKFKRLAGAVDALVRKNMQLWDLEDEARREDAPLSQIGKTKKRIDLANQQRNDLIDKIDELLERKVRKEKKRRSAH